MGRARTSLLAALLVSLLLVAGISSPARGQGDFRLFLPLASQGHSPAFMLADLTPGEAGSRLPGFRSVATRGDTLFFGANCGELWKSDGSAASTVLLKRFTATDDDCSFIWDMQALGDSVYFIVHTDGSSALWRSDGSAAGTRQVAPIAIPSAPNTTLLLHRLTALDGVMYFFASAFKPNSTVAALELWRSDGTAAGTARVQVLLGHSIEELALFEGRLFFAQRIGFSSELWASDGTAAGTERIASADGIFMLTAASGRLWFTTAVEGGYELWTSDGTAAGTRALKLLERGAAPFQIVGLGERIYFSLIIPPFGIIFDLWTSDGTPEGTKLVRGAGRTELHVHEGALYIIQGERLYRSDGTEAGTVQLNPALAATEPLFSAGPRLYFAGALAGTGGELWSSDGTAAGTRQLQEINPGTSGSDPHFLGQAGDMLYFSADDGVHGQELWALPLGQ